MADSDRVVVKTYVPKRQKSNWKQHADELDMSQSEYVRTMIQAGRRSFIETDGPDNTRGATTEEENTRNSENPNSSDATPRVDGLENRVLDSLETGPKSWDELLQEITGDLEADLDDTLQSLQEAGAVRYSGRTGGYERTDR